MNKLLRVAFQIARVYWGITRPISLGVVGVILRNEGREVLLVRHTYKPGWGFPAGGVKRGENVVEALKRELDEELGLSCLSEPQLLAGPLYSVQDGKHDHRVVFVVDNFEFVKPDQNCIEIAEFDFFPINDLPAGVGPGVRRQLDGLAVRENTQFYW